MVDDDLQVYQPVVCIAPHNVEEIDRFIDAVLKAEKNGTFLQVRLVDTLVGPTTIIHRDANGKNYPITEVIPGKSIHFSEAEFFAEDPDFRNNLFLHMNTVKIPKQFSVAKEKPLKPPRYSEQYKKLKKQRW